MNGSAPTSPTIYDRQQEPAAIALLDAQSYAYSQAKAARNRRVAVVGLFGFGLAVMAAFGGEAVNQAMSVISLVGAVVALVVGRLARHRESERVSLAVGAQEKFDTLVYQLEWNALAARKQPSPHEIARLSAKYTGDRFTEPWYPNTGTSHRPLDILICQQSNLGWGAPTHRRWAWTLALVTTVACVAPVALFLSGVLSGWQTINIFALPFTPLLVEAVEEVSRHFASARDKEEAHQLLLGLWSQSLGQPATDDDCRQVQDEIVHIRLRNAFTPDWFDQKHRRENEAAMTAAAQRMVTEAAQHGKG